MGLENLEEVIFTSQKTYITNSNDMYIDGVVLMDINHIFLDVVSINTTLKDLTREDILFALNISLTGVEEEIFTDLIEEKLSLTEDNGGLTYLIDSIKNVKEMLENTVKELQSKYQFYRSINEERIFVLSEYFSFIESILTFGSGEKETYVLKILLCSRR